MAEELEHEEDANPKLEDAKEGDRLPGEDTPADDSHILSQMSDRTIGEEGEEEGVDPEPEPEPEQELVSVSIGGVQYQMTKEAADAYHAEQEAILQANSGGSKQGDDFSEGLSDPAPGEDLDAFFDEVGQEVFIDPAKALKKVYERASNDTKQSLSSEYQADKARELFWTSFYNENPDLKGEDRFVQGVMSRPGS